jgi:hypothetical protein
MTAIFTLVLISGPWPAHRRFGDRDREALAPADYALPAHAASRPAGAGDLTLWRSTPTKRQDGDVDAAQEQDQEQDPDIAAARAWVLTQLRDGQIGDDSPLRLPSVHSSKPLSGVPAPLADKLRRREAALTLPTDDPMSSVGFVVGGIAFTGVIGGALLAGMILMLSHATVFAVVLGIVALPFLLGMTTFIRKLPAALRTSQHPLALSRDDRYRLLMTQHWESKQAWIGHGNGPERRLVAVACDTIKRIAESRAWSSGYLDDHRIRLDMIGELNEIDAQAFRIAVTRSQLGPARPEDEPQLAQPWNALLDRVAALRLYAIQMGALDGQLGLLAARDRSLEASGSVAELEAGSVRSDFVTGDLRGMIDELRLLGESLDEAETEHRGLDQPPA